MIELILREDVPSLGRAGQVVRVRPGYARNYLLPQGLAFEATEGNKKRIAAETRARSVRIAAERADAEAIAARLRGMVLVFSAKAGEDGRLFGSITAGDIAEEIAGRGVEIDRRKIDLEHPLKQVGPHVVQIKLPHEIQVEIQIDVNAEA
jgi:large subunit ribosomal protein L9